MQKQEYLELVQPFVSYLSEAWNGIFPHTFEIRDPAWVRQHGNRNWQAANLKEAYQQYWWNGDSTFATNTVTQFQNAWLHALAIPNPIDAEAAAKEVVYEIFKWGGVSACIKKAKKTENIREHIQAALAILTGETDDVPQFSESGFYMNSGYTKVYAITNNQLIIYDGRVGAALGLLARKFLENARVSLSQRTHAQLVELLRFPFKTERPTRGQTYVPPSKSTRNASLGPYTFGTLSTTNHSQHAKWTIRASWIVEAMLKQLDDPEITSRSIESALFMIGYKVRC